MKFQYFTFFLNSTGQQMLFKEKKTKIELLIEILQQPIKYEKRGAKLGYVFIKQEGDFIIGKLGKQSTIRRNLTPEKKFEEQSEENWPNCDIIFNINGDAKTGQRIAFEVKSYIFDSPLQHLKYLTEEINTKLFNTGYTISINPITTEQKFWDLVEHYKEQIQSLIFSYNAPNLFELNNNLNQDLKDAHDKYGATKISIHLDNPEGKIKVPGDAFVKQSAEWITRGGGEFTLKIKGQGIKKTITSGGNVLCKEFEEIEINLESSDKNVLRETLKKILL